MVMVINGRLRHDRFPVANAPHLATFGSSRNPLARTHGSWPKVMFPTWEIFVRGPVLQSESSSIDLYFGRFVTLSKWPRSIGARKPRNRDPESAWPEFLPARIDQHELQSLFLAYPKDIGVAHIAFQPRPGHFSAYVMALVEITPSKTTPKRKTTPCTSNTDLMVLTCWC